jgi:hypothetical protein
MGANLLVDLAVAVRVEELVGERRVLELDVEAVLQQPQWSMMT